MTIKPRENKSGAGSMSHPGYPVMSSADIKALPVKDISQENSLLFIWTTDYHLAKCIEVINSWGFEYKTVGFAWQKLNKSGEPVCFMGAYTLKSGVELCLIGARGKDAPKLVKNHKVRALIRSIREHHSKKPDEVRNRIVELVGDVPRVELFARGKFDGWDVWGNQIS